MTGSKASRDQWQDLLDDKLLTLSEVAELLQISPRTLCMMRLQGTGPTYVALTPKLRRYRRSDVLSWIEEKTTTPTPPPALACERVVYTPPQSSSCGAPSRRRN